MKSLRSIIRPDGRRIIVGMTLAILVGAWSVRSSAQPLAAGKNKFLGTGTSTPLHQDTDKHWNQITPGNAGKWGSVEATQGVYQWSNLDLIYDYAVNRGLPYKHHTLVWGNQQPAWIAVLDSAGQRLAVENWIKLVGERYPSMSFVDVVNEPLHAVPVYQAALGGAGVTGWDWVITSFQLARQHCLPGVKLILNEYNVLHSSTATTDYLTIIGLLKDRGLIDGIGVQGHYFEFRSDLSSPSTYVYDVATLKSNLDRLAATGLPVYITEFDIDEPVDSNQVAQYQKYFPFLWTHSGVKGITMWGSIQGDVWDSHPNTYVLYANGAERPAMQWLRTFIKIPLPPVELTPALVTGVARNPILRWKASATATSYRVEVSSNRTFSIVTLDSTVADTLVQMPLLAANTRYYWRVRASNAFGTSDPSTLVNFDTGDQVVHVGSPVEIPIGMELLSNHPNPFNPSTTLTFRCDRTREVRIAIYDALGRLVQVVADGTYEAGQHPIEWVAEGRLASGVYLARLTAEGESAIRRLLLMR